LGIFLGKFPRFYFSSKVSFSSPVSCQTRILFAFILFIGSATFAGFHPLANSFQHLGRIFPFDPTTPDALLNTFANRLHTRTTLITTIIRLAFTTSRIVATPFTTVITLALGYFHSLFCGRL
jgi:hypothetical protein